jgi:Cytochrome c7 and related cytochrome c/Cytochrome c554 and c-prime
MERALLTSCVLVVSLAGSAAAQTPGESSLHPSLCADCHYASGGKPNSRHWDEWNRSAHARANVGCEACHGGNPRTTEPFLAHQAIVRGFGPDSPVHRSNLPTTCGRCHTGPFVQFQKSSHYALLRAETPDGPSCSSCHGTASGALLNPKDFERECNLCHGAGKKHARLGYAATGRRILQSVLETRDLLKQAARMIKRDVEADRRASLQYSYDQAQVPLTEAVHAAHAFVFDDADERLGVARRGALALLDRLASTRSSR